MGSSTQRALARRVATIAIYPGVMGAAVGGGVFAMQHRWSVMATLLTVNVAAALLIMLLEYALPYRKEWLRSHGDVCADVCHLFVTGAIVEAVRTVFIAAVTVTAVRLASTIGASLWPSHWPMAIQLILALSVTEFGGYWAHRVMHATGWGWRLHAVHHSAPRLYWLNAQRIHPGDHLLANAMALSPLVLLGADAQLLTLVALVAGVHMMLQHANVDTRMGLLNWILSTGEVHRWHHMADPEVLNHNYGTILLIWDVVFRTRFFPKNRTVQSQDVRGVPELPEYPTDYLGQLWSPFHRSLWQRDERYTQTR